MHQHLVLPDVHVPYHDRRAWNLFLQVAGDWDWSTFVCLGDFLDLHSMSTHPPQSRKVIPSLTYELGCAATAFNELDESLPATTRRVYTVGNHEHRLERWLASNRHLGDVIDLRTALRLRDEWEMIPYRHHATIDNVTYTHDPGHCGKTAHEKALQYSTSKAAIIGHTHRMGYMAHGMTDTRQGAMFGCLKDLGCVDWASQLKAGYDWALGFGIVTVLDDTPYVQPIPIIDYKCVVNGHAYEG